MYAIVRAGGRQEKVSVDDVLNVDKLSGDVGSSVTLPAVLVVDDDNVISDPAQVGQVGQSVPDLKYKMMTALSADPDAHVRQLKMMRAMGATAVVMMNVSGADPLGTIRLYGDHVLPALRGGSGRNSE